jgi:hypothetical protein
MGGDFHLGIEDEKAGSPEQEAKDFYPEPSVRHFEETGPSGQM